MVADMTVQATYFTGVPCARGHIAKRYLSNKVCIECYKLNKIKLNSNPEYKARQKEYRAKTDRIRLYGITNKDYLDLFWKQNGKCKICENVETDKYKGKLKPLAVDHCHKTKKVRGLLCSKCNLAIGMFKHNPDILRKAAIYCE